MGEQDLVAEILIEQADQLRNDGLDEEADQIYIILIITERHSIESAGCLTMFPLKNHLERELAYLQCFSRISASARTFAAVNPNFSSSTPAGAEYPK